MCTVCPVYLYLNIYNSPDMATPLAVLFGPLGDVSVVKNRSQNVQPEVFAADFLSIFWSFFQHLHVQLLRDSTSGKCFCYEGAEIRSRVQFWIVFSHICVLFFLCFFF